VPIPSVADGFWLAFYIPAYLSLIMLIRLRLPQLSASLLLDGVIGALGVGSLSAAVVFNTVLEHASGDFGVVATGLAYQIGDLILLSLLIGRWAGRGGCWAADLRSSASATPST
jgi:hypothetical protein